MREGTYNGGTIVIDIAIPLALYLGAKEIILLGVDCDYSKEHHFDDYIEDVAAPPLQGDWRQVFVSYELLKSKINVEILNATKGTKLTIFEKVELENII